jgi:homotetrameric cytidine deaminase
LNPDSPSSVPALQDLHHAACQAREHAHAPYSDYRVGAAVVFRGSERIHAGCNVENASYGGTICAERAAICTAVAAEGPGVIDRLVLVTAEPAAPCGLCLQVISEFADADTRIFCTAPDTLGDPQPLRFFLPRPFDSNQLS